MSQIENEKTKLTANALDRASTASIAVGIFTPMVAVLYNINDIRSSIPGSLLFVGTVGWLLTSGALHLLARRTLNGLKQ
jgi:hypothetical protein